MEEEDADDFETYQVYQDSKKETTSNSRDLLPK